MIYLRYADGSSVLVSDYRFNGDRFEGTFCDGRTGERLATFSFVRVDNWRYQRNGRWNRTYRSRDYARKAAPKAKNDSIK